MSANRGIWKRKRDELGIRRSALILQLNLKPEDPGLAAQLRVIDAEILECTRNMEISLPSRTLPEAREN